MKKPRAFLEKYGPEWMDDFVYISRDPLVRIGFEIVPFDGEEIREYVLSKKDIVIGSVEACKIAFKELDVDIPKYIGFPESIQKYLGRKIEKVMFSDLDDNFPYFVKPANDVKGSGITGALIENKNQFDIFSMEVKDDLLVFKSEPVNFISEYRCFVSEGKLIGAKHYLGDFRKIIDFDIVDNIIKDFKEAPISYTIDMGLTDDGQTLLVEINDMWAIGSYGLDGRKYVSACKKRWFEILNK